MYKAQAKSRQDSIVNPHLCKREQLEVCFFITTPNNSLRKNQRSLLTRAVNSSITCMRKRDPALRFRFSPFFIRFWA